MDKEAVLNIAKTYANEVMKKYKNSKVFLFGSYAKDNQHPDSDIDIAVVLDDYAYKLDIMLELMRIRRRIDSRIEPHPIRKSEFNLSDVITSEVLTYGIPIN
jgi:predicted nucleotidyltransferase